MIPLIFVSSDRKTIKKQEDHAHAFAIATSGVQKGVRSWKWLVDIDGPGGGWTNPSKLHWIAIGITTEYYKNNFESFKRDYLNSSHNPTFSIDTWGNTGSAKNGEGFGSNSVSGAYPQIPPGTIITLTLDCDAHQLSYSKNNEEFLKITVPKNETLFPFARLYDKGNFVTFMDS